MRQLDPPAARRLGPFALALLLGCAAAPPRPEGMSGAAATAERVFAILEQRNAKGIPAPVVLSNRAFDSLLRALDPSGACEQRRAALAPRAGQFAAAVRAGDLAIVQDAALQCTGGRVPDTRAEALAFDAIARAFDPHAAFVDAAALAAEQRAPYEQLPEAQQARGRLVDPAGARLGWIVLPSFYLQASGRSASGDVAYLIDQLQIQGARAIVLDLRKNRGGVIEEAIRLASLLGAAGPIAREQRAGGATHELQARARRSGSLYGGPLALVVDADTAGVSEVFAAAITDLARGRTYGARTHGHGSAQTLVLLQSPKGTPEGALRVTDRYFVRIHGEPIEARGLTPNFDLRSSATDDEIARSIAADVSAKPLPAHLP